jgi:site-specific DNA-adenine methylase
VIGPLTLPLFLATLEVMSYPGGKASVHHKLINLMPPHDVYVEPFLGGGALLLAKRPALLGAIASAAGNGDGWLGGFKL